MDVLLLLELCTMHLLGLLSDKCGNHSGADHNISGWLDQYHSCWYPGTFCHLDISGRGIGYTGLWCSWLPGGHMQLPVPSQFGKMVDKGNICYVFHRINPITARVKFEKNWFFSILQRPKWPEASTARELVALNYINVCSLLKRKTNQIKPNSDVVACPSWALVVLYRMLTIFACYALTYVWDAVSIFNHLPRMFLSTDFVFRITDWTRCHGPHTYMLY